MIEAFGPLRGHGRKHFRNRGGRVKLMRVRVGPRVGRWWA